MDRWAWSQLEAWMEIRGRLPVGALLCVIHGATAGRGWEQSAARKPLRRAALAAGVRRRFAPHQLRHAHAVEMAYEGELKQCQGGGPPIASGRPPAGRAEEGCRGRVCHVPLAEKQASPAADADRRRSS